MATGYIGKYVSFIWTKRESCYQHSNYLIGLQTMLAKTKWKRTWARWTQWLAICVTWHSTWARNSRTRIEWLTESMLRYGCSLLFYILEQFDWQRCHISGRIKRDKDSSCQRASSSIAQISFFPIDHHHFCARWPFDNGIIRIAITIQTWPSNIIEWQRFSSLTRWY